MLRLPQLDSSRKCGPCTACCTALGVEELNKPRGVICKHICNGCAIYATRPESCRTYYCAWRVGFGLPEDRPDKIGVVCTYVTSKSVGRRVLEILELWEGAADEPRPSALIKQAAATQIVFIQGNKTRKPFTIIPQYEAGKIKLEILNNMEAALKDQLPGFMPGSTTEK